MIVSSFIKPITIFENFQVPRMHSLLAPFPRILLKHICFKKPYSPGITFHSTTNLCKIVIEEGVILLSITITTGCWRISWFLYYKLESSIALHCEPLQAWLAQRFQNVLFESQTDCSTMFCYLTISTPNTCWTLWSHCTKQLRYIYEIAAQATQIHLLQQIFWR
jgi:hypothetical protein